MSLNIENAFTLSLLVGLSIVYLDLLLSPSQPKLPAKPRGYVIAEDTKVRFDKFLADYAKEHSYMYSSSNSSSYNDVWTSSSEEWSMKVISL